MDCNCKNLDSIRGNDTINFITKLNRIVIDAYRWKGLYRCDNCKTFWEESFTDDRFGGEPILSKVKDDYVSIEWGEKYI